MTENEAIERVKTMAFMCDDFHNCKYGHDCTDGCSEAVKMAVDALQGSVKKKHIGSDNMVISSSDLMTILNSDSEELKQYKEVGTVEECRVAMERIKPKKPYYEGDGYSDGQLVYDYAKCPICGHDFEYGINDWESEYCSDCGQKLDWSE